MGMRNKKRGIRQNVSRMAGDIFDEIRQQVNQQPLKIRIILAVKILRGRW